MAKLFFILSLGGCLVCFCVVSSMSVPNVWAIKAKVVKLGEKCKPPYLL